MTLKKGTQQRRPVAGPRGRRRGGHALGDADGGAPEDACNVGAVAVAVLRRGPHCGGRGTAIYFIVGPSQSGISWNG